MNLIEKAISYLGYTKTDLAATPPKKNPLDWKERPTPPFVIDIAKWKKAEALAKSTLNPRFYALMLILEKTYNDAFLSSQIENRFNQSLAAPFVLKNAKGEIDIEETEKLKENPLYQFLTEKGLESKLFGSSLIDLNYTSKGLEPTLIPRTNINPIDGIFYKNYIDENGLKYREQPEYGTWWLEYTNKDPYGMMNKAVPHEIMKRFAQSCWAEHTEVFSIPPMVLKTDTTDTKMLNRGKKMMEEGRGRMAYFIVGQQEQLEFADQIATKGELYDGLITQCKTELSLLFSGAVIGQDTKNGSNAKESSSQDLLWYLVQSDMATLETQWNRINLPALVKHGVVKEGLKFQYEKAEDIAQLWKFVSESMQYYEYDPKWLKQKFGLEVIAPKNTSSQGNTLAASKGFFLEASATTEANNCCGQAHILVNLSGTLANDDLIQRYWDAQGTKLFDQELFTYTVQNLTEAFSKGWQQAKENLSFGIEYGNDDPMALTAYEMNLFRFAGIKTLAESQMLNKAFRESTSFEDFRIKASVITKIHNTEWLRTEYNTAQAVGSTSSTYYRLKKQLEIFPYWEYKTVDDNRVRLEHQRLDGLLLRADDPIWKQIYPPNGWNCRCYVVPRLKSEKGDADLTANEKEAKAFTLTEEFTKAKKSGWGVNRADTKEVFTANQQYIANASDANKLISSLSPKDYKMKQISNPPTREVFEGDAQSFFAEKAKDNILSLTDYNNRSLVITKADFTTQTEDAQKKELLHDLSRVLTNPDEVWYKSENKGTKTNMNQFLYIKYFEDLPVGIVAELTKTGDFKLKTFFQVTDFLIRWGLLIK